MIIATIACNNYLPKAMFLAKTARAHHPDATIILCLFEKTIHNEALECDLFDRIVLASDLYDSDFESFVFKHEVVEAATAVKPRLLSWAFSQYCDEKLVVYLDPDIWVFSRFDELLHEAGFAIAVTPHHLRDEPTAEAVRDNVLRTLQCGTFNLGFLALNRSQTTSDFLDWWDSRLRMFCYVDFPRGLFVDQKWIDRAMSFFDLHVLRHPGYNVAFWNISQRNVVEEANEEFSVNGEPLRFVHFSGIDSGRDQGIFQRYTPSPNAAIHDLRKSYLEQVQSFDRQSLSQEPWSYGFFETGERVAYEVRLACRKNPALLKRYPHPFKESNDTFIEVVRFRAVLTGRR